MNEFKLVTNQQCGKYKPGDQITDPDEIEKLLAGPMRKRFHKVPLHPGDAPHVEVTDEEHQTETE